MPQHIRAQILAAAVDALTGLPTTGANVFPSRTCPIPAGTVAALLVYTPGGASRPDSMSGGLWRDEQLVIEARVQTKGREPDDLFLVIAAEIEPALQAHAGLAALTLSRDLVNSVSRAAADVDVRHGVLTLTYNVPTRTTAADPTTSL